jgi:hypothetical protein
MREEEVEPETENLMRYDDLEAFVLCIVATRPKNSETYGVNAPFEFFW